MKTDVKAGKEKNDGVAENCHSGGSVRLCIGFRASRPEGTGHSLTDLGKPFIPVSDAMRGRILSFYEAVKALP
ncbi:MAG: hypothetical protein DRI57_24375 [Deltaproteobacteria bacterium]|nr:MAG: hypothetical protein DRI57_24375 [Deltaproteobacteria bacterium]